MSLLDEFMEDCTIIDKKSVADGYGGTDTQWVDGAKIKAAITFDTSMQARVGEKQGVTSTYTVTTPRGVSLQFHDVIRREKDKKIFRITSDGDDKYTPNSASLDMRQVTAEEWVIPTGEN